MATVAKTKQDVENMTRQERLWDSLSDAYGKQMEASDKSYNQAISQADRQMLSRGMQRSSYGAQVLGNLNNQKVRAQNDINSALIADYENRLNQQEQQDAENERWERQFAETQKQNEWSRNFQQQQADTQNQQWQMNFDAGRSDAAWQQGMTEKQYADSRADTAWNQAFQQRQADLAADQWDKQFASGNDSADRQLAASYVSAIVANGGTPSDDLLARAGLSRADAEAMRKGATGSGGKSGTTTPPGSNTPPASNPDAMFDDVDLSGGNNGAMDNLAKRAGLGLYGALNNMNNKSTPATTEASRTALVDNNSGNPNRFGSPSLMTIDPIDAAFSNPGEEYYEVDVDDENDPRVLRGKGKTTNGAGSKIKQTTVKLDH